MQRLSILVVFLLISGCTTTPTSDQDETYVHFVAMWLKNPANEQDRQKIIDTTQSFVGKIPGLVSVSAGRMKPSTRPVVDSTYDIGLVMTFDSEQALNAYPSHPIHQQAVKEVITPLVDHFKVYDFVTDKAIKGRSGERPFGSLDSTLR